MSQMNTSGVTPDEIRRRRKLTDKMGPVPFTGNSDLSQGRQEAMRNYYSTATPSEAAPSAPSPSSAAPQQANPRTPAEMGVQPGVTPEAIRQRMQQRELRAQLLSEQQGFRNLDPAAQADAVARMNQIKAAHTGISASLRPPDALRTPEQEAEAKARLQAQLTPLLEKQRADAAGELASIESGTGIRNSDVAMGARQAPGIAGQKFSSDQDRYGQRDTLAMIGRQAGQVDYSSENMDMTGTAREDRLRQRAALNAKLAGLDSSLATARSGQTFGPTPQADQLQAEYAARGQTRDSQISVGKEAERSIAARAAERERVRKAIADQAALVPETQNAEMRGIASRTGPMSVADAQNKVAGIQANAEVDQAMSDDAMRKVGIANPQATADQIGSAVKSMDPTQIDAVEQRQIKQVEDMAKVYPAGAARYAQTVLAAFPTDAQLEAGIGTKITNAVVPGGFVLSQQRALAVQRIKQIRARLEAVAGMGVAAAAS